jgi:4-amino-4-deoxy-L-arabinose transferase-like glycosyltransferase
VPAPLFKTIFAGSTIEAPVAFASRRAISCPRAAGIFQVIEQLILGLAAIFFALHFLHLRADFPNNSPWVDSAKYTDEGWYGDAAIRHYQLGHWNVPGDFNPAAALPVWPAIEAALFRVTGVSLVAARALTVFVFGFILVACYWLLRRWAERQPRGGHRSFAPAMAVLLLSVNPFCYAFTRIAILEPLLVLLALCALILADRIDGRAKEPNLEALTGRRWPRLLPAVVLGFVLPLIVLTKTTGLFLFPAIFYVLWSRSGRNWSGFLRSACVSGGIGGALWIAYYSLVIRPHFLEDYRYLFSANTYTRITADTFWSVLNDTLMGGTWIGHALFWSSLTALVAWLVFAAAKGLRGSSLPVALLFWVFGYTIFLVYHANLAPRYYVVLAVPLVLLLALGVDSLLWAARLRWRSEVHGPGAWLLRIAALGSALTVAFILVDGARQTLRYVRHPEYTFVTAVRHLQDAVQRELTMDPQHSALVLSVSGSDISLITGLRSICDDFGTMELPDRVAAYKPGWFAAWNDVEDDKMEALAPMYRVVRVGAYPAYDDPERNLLILYRLDPLSSPGKGHAGRRRYFVSPHRRPARTAARKVVSP